MRNLFRLNKWYFDLVTPGGDAMYSYFITVRIAGFGLGLASMYLRYAGGDEIRASARTGFAAPDAGGNLSLGRHSFIRDEGRVNVRLNFEDIHLNLCYKTELGAWEPTVGGKLWSRGKRFLFWEVAQSVAAVEGTITTDSREHRLSGLGYQDIVETSIPPWKLPIAELIWGRAHCEAYVVVFNQIKTREGEVLQNLFFRKSAPPPRAETESQGTRGGPSVPDPPPDVDQTFSYVLREQEGEETIVHRDFRLILRRSAVLEESLIATPERFQSRFLMRFLNRVCGHPTEFKILSAADLELEGIHHSGWAIHERVTWNWPEKELE